jgi:DNA-binding NtrC family response regulator
MIPAERLHVLVVEDDSTLAEVLCEELVDRGHETAHAQTVSDALRKLRDEAFDVALLDLMLPDGRGTDVLRRIAEEQIPMEAIVLTGYAELSTAIEAMKLGAYDYLTKPVRMEEVAQHVAKAGEKTRLRRENASLKHRLQRQSPGGDLVTEDPALLEALATVARVAPTDLPVLIQGESGTGKDLVARAVHARSARADQPFVAVNCGSMPEALLESELFGFEKGAFTGADHRKPGLFELAERGTLFLDEIGELPPAVQAKLLRAVESGEVVPLGASRALRVDVRIVSATNRDLRREVRDGRFREDFYFRLNGISVRLPPLRDRRKDVALLASHFLGLVPGARKTLGPAAVAKLESYSWPGNVRELQMVIRRSAVMARRDVIEAEDLPIDLVNSSWRSSFKTGLTLAELEKEYIKTVLQENQGHRGRTARALGIDAKTLYNKIGAERPRTRPEDRRSS